MNHTIRSLLRSLGAAGLLLLFAAGEALAVIDGVSGTTFNLTAKSDYISTGDGNSIWAWGYSLDAPAGSGVMQYPGPVLILNEGQTVTINLHNTLPVPVSMIFPGQQGVTATGGAQGLITHEALTGSMVTYTFTASQPGTYLYQSGTQQQLQVEMGLVGAIVVRPSVADPLHQAYEHPATAFDREYLFLLTEMDAAIHDQVEAGQIANVDNTVAHPVLWFINGRNGPDTLLDAGVPWLPTQPYNALPRMHAGEKILLRVANGGRALHPFHTHGNNVLLFARDGRVLESAPGAGPDLASSEFTIKTIPGETYDATFQWTGQGIGWDVYGTAAANSHTCTPNANGFDPVTHEWCADHNKPLPVSLPNQLDLTFGEFYSGSPYLGKFGVLPVGHPGLNDTAGFFHMWHSHTERELTNNDIFPGGMMTMLIIEPRSVTIP
jgi:FtsP/CotA-like multicopper oxidase with cupredoxin domain